MASDETVAEFYVRPAMQDEYEEIGKLIQRVHATAPGSSEKEAKLVQDLVACGACDPELSLVAIQGGCIVGYTMFSNIGVRGRPAICGVAIAPLCVDAVQNQEEIRNAIMNTGRSNAFRLGKSFICVQGDAAFYRRFHFHPAPAQGIETPFRSERDLYLPAVGAKDVGSGSSLEYPAPWYVYAK